MIRTRRCWTHSSPHSRYNDGMSLIGMLRFAVKSILGGPKAMLKPGAAAPEFVAPDHNGKALSLRDLRGRKVVLWFYPKADTPG
jgi:hypothetical protein